jgi:uncharacterized phage infection (PIP) family protein YhgE
MPVDNPVVEEDPFTEAFADFSKPEAAPVEPAPIIVAIPEPEPVIIRPTEPGKSVEEPTGSVEKPAESVKSVEKPAELVEKPPESIKSVENHVDTSAQDAETLRQFMQTIKDAAKSASQPTPQPVRPAQPSIPELYTPEEKEFLTTYEKDWNAVARGEALRRKAEYRDLISYIYNDIGPHLRAMQETLGAVSERSHLEDLYQVAQDYDDIRDKVVDWAQKQPTYLKVAYNHVIENGSTEEVQHLIDTWRKETGAAVQTVQTPAAPPKQATELTPAAKQAAARLAPVSSKRAGVQVGIDPSDFGSAFEAFAKQLN